jgi:hypothetical protein
VKQENVWDPGFRVSGWATSSRQVHSRPPAASAEVEPNQDAQAALEDEDSNLLPAQTVRWLEAVLGQRLKHSR